MHLVEVVSLFLSRSRHLVDIVVLQVYESDITHRLQYTVRSRRCTPCNLPARKQDNLSNNAPQPPSCGYSDVTLMTSIVNSSKELNGIEILVGHAVLMVMSQNSQNVVWINNSELLGLSKF